MAMALIPIFVALMAVLVGGGHLLARHSRFFREQVNEKLQSSSYESHLDGLRGLSAFAVFVHHAAYIWPDIANGGWRQPDSHFMELLGGGGVSMFFFLSGYLFWSRCLRLGTAPFSARRFYRQRLFRIAPVYWLFCIVMVVMVLWDAGGTLRTTLGEFARSVAQWLVFGVPMGHFPDVNAFPLTRMINGDVAWSLRHEVLFYLMLPLLLPWARQGKTVQVLALFVVAYAVLALIYGTATSAIGVQAQSAVGATLLPFLKDGLLDFNKFLLIGFAPGLLAAHVLHHERYRPLVSRIEARHALWAALICLLLLLLNTDPRFSFLKLVPLSVVFFLVVARKLGTRLLRLRGLVVLGLVSYSVYVFHGVFLFALQPQGLGIYKALAMPGAPAYWVLTGVVGLLVLAVCAVLYRWIESPCMQWGKRDVPGAAQS